MKFVICSVLCAVFIGINQFSVSRLHIELSNMRVQCVVWSLLCSMFDINYHNCTGDNGRNLSCVSLRVLLWLSCDHHLTSISRKLQVINTAISLDCEDCHNK